MARSSEAWQPRDDAPTFVPGDYPAYALERLRRGWQRLGEDERDSVIAATLVASDLARLGAPSSVLGEAARVIEDEVRHVEVCNRVLAQIGAEALEVPPTARRRPSDDAPDLESKCARDLFAGFAVGESMSAACFAACRSATKDPLIRWALTELLRDEARHGAFGVRAGAWVIRNWDAAKRSTLWPACVSEMEAFERAVGGPIAQDAVPATLDPYLSALGMLPPYQTCAAALACLPRWVLRPLTTQKVAPIMQSTEGT